MDSPNPVPSDFVVKNGSKIVCTTSLGIPHPLSITWMLISLFLIGTVWISIVPSSETASAAFNSRFKRTWCRCVESISTLIPGESVVFIAMRLAWLASFSNKLTTSDMVFSRSRISGLPAGGLAKNKKSFTRVPNRSVSRTTISIKRS